MEDSYPIPVPVPPSLIGFIRQRPKFLVAGHKEPDGDSVGSQLALCSALRRMGKEAIPCSAGPFKRGEVKPFQDLFVNRPGEEERKDAAVIIVDCSEAERTGDLEPCLRALPTAVIDHHEPDRHDSQESPAYVDSAASAAALLTLKVIEELGLEPTREEAELLFLGLCTDTGFFRHVEAGASETFSAAARLVRYGASPKDAFQAMHGGKSLESRLLLGRILSRSQSYFEGKLILSTEDLEDTLRFGLEGRDSDSLYQLLQSVKGVEAIAIIRQEKEDLCTIGFRSRSAVDVAAVAAVFGGGGHKNAAGVSVSGQIAAIQPKILEVFQKVFG